jgi:c-di-GMP-binding flagellar brake protein YcgR
MLKQLKNLLPINIFKKQNTKNDLNRSGNPNFLIEPNKINKVLREIEATFLLCTVQIDGSKRSYSTSILKIETATNTIVLDELIPKEGNALLQEKKALKLSTFHQGLHLAFNLSQIESGIENGVTYYKAPLPERIFYPQRRKSPRVKVSLMDISFSGIAQGGTLVRGHVFDLSQEGAGINVNLPMHMHTDPIQRGDKLKKCQIVFDNFTMNFDFLVYLVKPLATGSSKVQIGGLFENISSKNQSKLENFITSVELTEIRKRRKTKTP